MSRRPPAWGVVAVGLLGYVAVLLIGRWVEPALLRLALYAVLIVGVGWLAVARFRTLLEQEQHHPQDGESHPPRSRTPPNE